MNARRILLAGLFWLAVPHSAPGASLGVDLQAYPAGLIGTGRIAFVAGVGEVALHGGYDLTNRHDWGEHEDETGGGPGFGVAWRRPWRESSPWVFGLRNDVWFLTIDWEQDGRTGHTDVVVLQPTAHVGYRWALAHEVSLVAHAALGAEINVDTKGEDVGQGAIVLLGLTASIGP